MPKAKKKKKSVNICGDCKVAPKPAITAAKLGHTQCLTTAYRELGVFNERDDYGATPIHFAARFGKLDCLMWLVTRSGVSPNAVSRNGATAAHDAAAMGHLECLQYLIKNTRCSIEDATSEGATVLHMACRFGRLEVVKWLMEYSGSSPSGKGANDVTPVHLCAAKNHLGCLKWLTQHPKYVPNEQTVHGATPVYFASQEGSVQCLQWLVEHGDGDPYITATDGMGPIHAASQAGQIKCLEYLVKKASVSIRHRAEDSATPAHFAAASGQVQCLEWILENGGSMEDRDNLGGTPLHDAAEQGQMLTLSTLIRHGANLDLEDHEGLKPVDLARNNNYEDCFKLLFRTVKTDILISLTPLQSLTRASAEDEEEKRLREEKQRRFEEVMLGDMSEERKEAIWQSAQQRASNVQPGLKLLLEGKAPPPPSTLDVERGLGGKGSAIHLSATGSLRHSRHSTGRKSIKNQMNEDFLPDDLHPYKPRPHLTPDLFQQPDTEESHLEHLHMAPSTGASGATVADAGDEVVLRNNAAPNDARKSEYRQSADSPIPPRAKFLKKFGIKKKPSQGRPSEKKMTRKQSIEHKQDPLSKKTSSSAVAQKSPQKSDKLLSAGRLVKQRSGSAAMKQKPVQRKLSKNKMSSPPQQQAQRRLSKTKLETKDAQMSKQKKSPKVKKTTVPEKEREKKDDVDVHTTEDKPSDSPYILFANNFVEEIIRDSVSSRGSTSLVPEKEGADTTSEPESQTQSPPVHLSSDVMETNVEATSLSPSDEVILRPKKKLKQTFNEEVVISKSNVRKSLKTPDETVTVSFVTKATNIKQSFPITHHALMGDDDLSSPGSSGEEDEAPQRESFTVPGFDRLDPNTFEMFGDDMNELEVKRKHQEKEWENEDSRKSFREDESNKHEQKPLKEEEVIQKSKLDETKSAAVNEKSKDQDAEPAETDSETKLTRWNKEQTLHEVDDSTTPEISMVEVNSPTPIEGAFKQSEKTSIVQTGTTDIYNKFQDFERLKKERGFTDVMKMVTQLQGKKQETKSEPVTSRTPPRGPSRLGNVSAKLAMFGGGAAFIKPPQDTQESTTEETSTSEEEQPPKSPSDSEEDDKRAESPTKETSSVRQPDLQASAEVTASFLQPRQRMRSTSSLISITTFETIKEEEDESETEENDDLERVESTDKITPLPKMPPPLSRRHSEELLRLDGIEPAAKQDDKTTLEESPPRSRALDLKDKDVRRSPSPTKRRHSGGSSVYSPLMQSSDASNVVQKREKSNAAADKPRPLSVPPSPPKGSEAMALYMNSANLPHLNHLRVRHDEEKTNEAETLVEALLSKPTHTQVDVPLEFRDLVIPGGRPKFNTWKQKDDGSLQKLTSLDSVRFEQDDIYILLYVAAQGPLLRHVFVWVGRNVDHSELHAAYQHCQNLVNTLPGRPVVHKEFQGYESFRFLQSLKSGGKSITENSLSYLNPALEKAKLYVYNTTGSSFEMLAMDYQSVTKMTVPVVMDTCTRVHVWLPRGGAQLRQTPMEIAELFIIHNSYPKWTPVSVMIQDGETDHFISHFPSWPCLNLKLSSRSAELRLPSVRLPNVTYPVTGQTKIWCLEKKELKQVPLDRFGHFNSSDVYLVQYVYNKHSALFTWVEGMVYVWVGAHVQQRREDVVKIAYEKCKVIGPNSKMPVVIVPEGKEPTQLLNLFRGQFIIHKTWQESPELKMYRVSGSSALTMKAVEVPAKASSLHSCHAYLLLNESGKLYAWSGQFSSKIPRRGALVIAKMLPIDSSDCIKLAEGLESPEFWTQLEGKSKYPQFIPEDFPSHSRPAVLYSCEAKQGVVVFVPLPATKKEELKSNTCYILQYRDQLFIREGGYWRKGFHQLDVIRSFIQQFHSWKSENDFNITLVTEGNEGEMYWKWFDIQNVSSTSDEDDKTVDSEVDHTNLGEESDTVQLRHPPTSQPVSLTRSQEVAFENVEKLQEQLESLTVAEAGESDGLRGNSQEEGEQEAKDVSDEAKSKKEQESPFKTSQTVKDLGHLIEGLDNLLKSNSQASAMDKDVMGPEEGSGISLQPPSMSKLLSQTDIVPEEQSPEKKTKAVARRSTVKSAASMVVTVEIADGRGVYDVSVKEKAPVISVIFKAAKMAGISLKPASALFEVSESLKIHRPLEDHELIKDIMAQWPTKNRPKFVLRDFATKNMLWASRPPIPKQAITAYVKHNKVPEVSARLLYCKKGGSKLTWKEGSFFLRALGIYNITDTKKASKIELCSSLDHHVYTPTTVQGRGYETPNPYCFIMKPPNSWKDKDLKFYCLSDIQTMAKWVHTIRLLKHGLQLKGNFIAMKTRLQKLQDDESKPQQMSSQHITTE